MLSKSFLLKTALPIIIFAAGTDRILKSFIFDYLRSIPEKSIAITSFFSITQVWNLGVSFGFLRASESKGIILLLLLTTFIIGFLIYLLLKAQTSLEVIGLSCIIGGAFGNLLDRLYYGAVYDFLDFHLLQIHFWTFNPADAYITIGAVILIVDQIISFLNRSKG